MGHTLLLSGYKPFTQCLVSWVWQEGKETPLGDSNRMSSLQEKLTPTPSPVGYLIWCSLWSCGWSFCLTLFFTVLSFPTQYLQESLLSSRTVRLFLELDELSPQLYPVASNWIFHSVPPRKATCFCLHFAAYPQFLILWAKVKEYSPRGKKPNLLQSVFSGSSQIPWSNFPECRPLQCI